MGRRSTPASLGSRGVGPLEKACFGALLIAVLVGLSIWVHRVNAATPVIVDELVYLWQAGALADGALTRPAPQHPEFVNVPFIPVKDGRRFGQYPIGYSAALAPWTRVGIPWALNVVLAAVSLWLLFVFARRLDGAFPAWLAAGLTAVSPFFVAQSTIYFSHPLSLVLTLLFLVALAARDGSPHPARWMAIAGAAAGYSINMSPFVTLPMLVVGVLRWRATRRSRPMSRGELAAFAAPIAAGAAVFGAVNFAMTGDPFTPAYSYNTAFTSVRAGFGTGVGEGGFTPAMALANTRDRLAFLGKIALGWPGTSFLLALPYAVIALATPLRGARRRARPPDVDISRETDGERTREGDSGSGDALGADRWDLELVALFVSTVVVYAFWFFPAIDETMGPRYLYTTLPVVTLFTARGLAHLGDLARRALASRPWSRPVGVIAPVALAATLTAFGAIPYLGDLARNPLSAWRRATHRFLLDLDRSGIRAGTIFVEAPWENTLAASLLYASNFDEDQALVFAMDRGPAEDARFLESRGGGPVYYVKPRMPLTEWKLHDRPVWERQGGEAP